VRLSVTATASIPPDWVAEIERRLESVARSAGDRLPRLHASLRSEGEPGAPTYVADALAFLDGRDHPRPRHGAAPPLEAGEALAEELGRRLARSGL
jgi:hypothetical protein